MQRGRSRGGREGAREVGRGGSGEGRKAVGEAGREAWEAERRAFFSLFFSLSHFLLLSCIIPSPSSLLSLLHLTFTIFSPPSSL
jgi:hypothetical protein